MCVVQQFPPLSLKTILYVVLLSHFWKIADELTICVAFRKQRKAEFFMQQHLQRLLQWLVPKGDSVHQPLHQSWMCFLPLLVWQLSAPWKKKINCTNCASFPSLLSCLNSCCGSDIEHQGCNSISQLSLCRFFQHCRPLRKPSNWSESEVKSHCSQLCWL